MKNTVVKQEERDGYILTMILIDMDLPKKIKDMNPSMNQKWLNGYLTLPSGHVLEGKRYDDTNISVHGGITFSDKMEGLDGWTIGFDTNHFHDNIEICNEDYVWREIESMYEQALAKNGTTNI